MLVSEHMLKHTHINQLTIRPRLQQASGLLCEAANSFQRRAVSEWVSGRG